MQVTINLSVSDGQTNVQTDNKYDNKNLPTSISIFSKKGTKKYICGVLLDL